MSGHYVWVRWRTKSASGPGDWHYTEWWWNTPLTTDAVRTAFYEDFKSEFIDGRPEWIVPRSSDHFRGVEVEIIESPPLTEIEKQLEAAQRALDSMRARVVRLGVLRMRLRADAASRGEL